MHRLTLLGGGSGAAGGGAGDPSFSNVKLLIGANGTNGSTTIPDESSAARGNATVTGNAQIDTAQFKFGVSSAKFDGSGDGLSWAAHADWNLGTVWTVECFARLNAFPGDQHLMGQWVGIGTAGFMLRPTSSAGISFFAYDGGAFVTDFGSASSILSTGTWYHFAVDSNGTKVRLYKDGVMIGSQTPSNTNCGNASAALTVGLDGLGGRPVNGWLDEVRITKGVARYNSDAGYTVPAAAFPRS